MEAQLEVFYSALDAVCINWNQKFSKTWGFEISVDEDSIIRSHGLWWDILAENPGFPPEPGPFKCAAAYLVATWAEIKFNFRAYSEEVKFTPEQEKLWASRFLFKSLSVVLKQWGLKRDGQTHQLGKTWDVPTVHYRLEFLHFLRWTELPLEGKPAPLEKPQINIVRTNRLIMALALIIESCYYQSENSITCDVMGKAVIHPSELHEDIEPDLYFDYEEKP